MTNSIIKSKNISIVDQSYIDGRLFGLVLPFNIASCAAQHVYGLVVTNLGRNDAGLFFFKNKYDEIVAVDVTKIDLIKVYKVKVEA